MKTSIKIVGANAIFSQYLNQEFNNIQIQSAGGAFIFKLNEREDIFVNPNPKVKFVDEGILIEGYCVIGDCLGNLSILITKLS